MLLTIEKLIYGGDGLARLAQDEHGRGKAVFIPFVLEGERVQAEITEEKPGFARALLETVVQPSPQRVVPGCPYFGECGGCHYQHSAYDHQLEIKTWILREAFRRIAKADLPTDLRVHASPPWNYRNRTRMRVVSSLRAAGHSAAPDNAASTASRFVLGYNRFRSDQVLAVRECPISSPLINRAIAAVWQLGESGAVPGTIQEIECFANAEDDRLLLELTVAEPQARERRHQEAMAVFARSLRTSLPELAGTATFTRGRDGRLARVMPPKDLREDFGADELAYRTAPATYRVGAGAFFQTNRFLTDELVSIAASGASGESALDLYAGVGLFSVPLSRNFRKVAAVEASPLSYRDLRRNCPPNLSTHNTTTEKFLAALPKGTHCDSVLVDPPRGGLGERLARALAGLNAPRVTYVSCDPATVARDARVLLGFGYRIEETHLIDLFPQTFHIETVLRFMR